MASGAREWVSVCVSYFAQTKWKYVLGLSIIHSARIFFFLLKNKMCIFCRLNGDQNGGAWCSASPVSRDLGSKEYIEGNSSAQSSSLQIYSNLHKFTHFPLKFFQSTSEVCTVSLVQWPKEDLGTDEEWNLPRLINCNIGGQGCRILYYIMIPWDDR